MHTYACGRVIEVFFSVNSSMPDLLYTMLLLPRLGQGDKNKFNSMFCLRKSARDRGDAKRMLEKHIYHFHSFAFCFCCSIDSPILMIEQEMSVHDEQQNRNRMQILVDLLGIDSLRVFFFYFEMNDIDDDQ